ncbi:acetate and sugar kinases/Hsc70/actin family protein [Hymenobacter swuensis]|uniref:Ppx/GppA phosphatase domain-containing protein n=1 Tax=Hymenobacter swuensis DY53 TaxID=1227739 RepID=W8EW77_9BACT|nr:hypothetical protein [Hymenobacter swuensis]AHJ96002.1 hypothetical protein Hsw_0407 [Hymenobacter swuensis DY53]
MQRLTLAGRLIITAIVLVAAYFGVRYFLGDKMLKPDPATATTTEITTPGSTPTAADGSPISTTTTAAAPTTFTYAAPAPVNGKLKGVVELGASGFNSFIVRIDEQKNWKLEKAEFGTSLAIENMASDNDIRTGLKAYIAKMLDFGVPGRDIQFVVSSGALKAEGTQKIIKALKGLGYVVNTVTPEREGQLALRSVLPRDYADKSFVVDIGSGNTKISWLENGTPKALETYGAKYFQNGTDDAAVAADVKAKAGQVPAGLRKTCFIIGGIPYELAKQTRKGDERYTVLNAADAYKLDNAKSKAGQNIYRSVQEATGCQQFVFDWDANFTIGFLLSK